MKMPFSYTKFQKSPYCGPSPRSVASLPRFGPPVEKSWLRQCVCVCVCVCACARVCLGMYVCACSREKSQHQIVIIPPPPPTPRIYATGCVCFTWPIRKEGPYKQTTRGPKALGPLRGIGQWRSSHLPKGTILLIWTGDITIESPWSYALSHSISETGTLQI